VLAAFPTTEVFRAAVAFDCILISQYATCAINLQSGKFRRKSGLNPLICPVQPHFQKYFGSRPTQIKSISLTSHPTKGRIAIVTDAGWDAVDAAASGA
jgi:hypothetical protein